MRHMVITKFCPSTGKRGARIVARLAAAPRNRVVVPYDHSKDPSENHLLAAVALGDKLGLDLDPREIAVGVFEWGFVSG